MLKGTVSSPETIQAMKRSKLLLWRSRLSWENVPENLWDIEIDNGSRNRRLNFITFRQFKEKAESGQAIPDMVAEGISKHLLAFYSKLAQAKIMIPKESFRTDYSSGMSLDEIASKYDLERGEVTFVRQLYQCKATGAKYQARKKTEIPLTQRQKDILYGTLMGDGKKMSGSSAAFKHGPKQEEYLRWKHKEFESVASRVPYETRSVDKKTGKDTVSWEFYTKANTDVECILEQFYGAGRKRVTSAILDSLTPLSIAVWYQDDGRVDFFQRSIEEHSAAPEAVFCTESFTKEECLAIIDWFMKKYGIRAFLKGCRKGLGNRIRIHGEDFGKFVCLVKPHMLPMFYYKVDHRAYVEKRGGDDQQVTLVDLLKCPLGNDFRDLPLDSQDEWVRRFLAWLRKKGFNRLVSESIIAKDMDKALKLDSSQLFDGNLIRFCKHGSQFVLSHFPNFWSARSKGKMSPREVFENDSYLSEIIRGLLLERRPPRGKVVLSKLRYYRGNKSVSLFMPCMAKAIYDRYVPDGGKVFDFCGGYGGRLFGAMVSQKVASYTATEANPDSCSGLKNLSISLEKEGIRKETVILNCDSIEGMRRFSDKSFNFCFTSVPYFDAEDYSDDAVQSSRHYPEFGQWVQGYLFPSLVEAARISQIVAINVADTGSYKIVETLMGHASSYGLSIKEEMKLAYPRYGGGKKYEPLLFVSESKGNDLIFVPPRDE